MPGGSVSSMPLDALDYSIAINQIKGFDYHRWTGEDYLLEERTGARNLRKTLQTKVHQQKSVVN